jgi:uncharacterized protein (TIGR02145 family)
MKNKSRNFIASLFLAGVLLFSISSCKKDSSSSSSSNNPYNGKSTAVFNPNVTYGTMTDQDGNTYKTVVIGTQTWMAENLRTTKYRNDDAILDIQDSTKWVNLSSSAFCNYNNTANIDTIATYGRLYNWYAAIDVRNIAPAGWHVPNDSEWTALTKYLDGESVAGGKLKEIGLAHWQTPNTGATNESGYTALPGSERLFNGVFVGIGAISGWWSSSESNAGNAGHRYLSNGDSYVYGYGYGYPKLSGLSVRCLKNN